MQHVSRTGRQTYLPLALSKILLNLRTDRLVNVLVQRSIPSNPDRGNGFQCECVLFVCITDRNPDRNCSTDMVTHN